MTNTKKQTANSKTQRLVGLAILTAIVIVLQYLSVVIGKLFPMLPFSITLTLIPIVIGAAMYGMSAGAYLGGVFSVIVIINSISGIDAGGLMVWQANPALCVVLCMVKGVAAGFVAGLVYKLLSGVNVVFATFAAAICAPVVNTGIFICGMFLFFKPTLDIWASANNQNDVLFYALFIMAGVNFLIEFISNIVLSPVVVKIIHAVKKQK